MKPDKFVLLIGVAVLTISLAQILSWLGVAKPVDWSSTLGIAVAGTCLAYIGRDDRLLLGLGSFVVLTSVIYFMKQLGTLPAEITGSIQLGVAGLLIVAFQFLKFPLQLRSRKDPH